MFVLLAPLPASADDAVAQALRWRIEARESSIVRDSWGIAHVYGKSDADTVFAGIYAQAEDDFHRIEHNYLVSLGWLARAEGDAAVYSDLRQRLFVDPAQLPRLYRGCPDWLKALMTGWADGLNFYLVSHPEVHPAVIAHFEPWMALSFTEGSIGGDIEEVDLGRLATFYPLPGLRVFVPPTSAGGAAPGGSNGFAIAPSRSASGHALLWINPHTSFYFRAELQMTSESGLDEERLGAFSAAIAALPWGEINRFQRRTGDIVQPFDDAKTSLPVGFAPAFWGALASFDSSKPRTTRRIYGSVGNSFVAAVEFGPTVRAKAIMAGGESGNPMSPHFADQASLYAEGKFRDVLFTPQDVEAHAVRRYHPGDL